jgi:hypothetical protein
VFDMPFHTKVIVSPDDFSAVPEADNTRDVARSLRATLGPGKMGGLIYFVDKKTQACHINFLAFGPLSADLKKTHEKLKLLIMQKGDRNQLIASIFGPTWEAHLCDLP